MGERLTVTEYAASPEVADDCSEIIALAQSHIEEAKRKQMRSTMFFHWIDLTAVAPAEAEEVACHIDSLMNDAQTILTEEGYTVSHNSNPHGEDRPLPTMQDVCFYTTKITINW
ncbi:hypothetical protein KC973_03700 [Candidatus Saccharibacteria bacterium]|nr:hypothetical protein [Candidatus Saccharibacteria bacterium]